MLEINKSFSADKALVAHFNVSNMGTRSSIICQCSSLSSRVLVSCSFANVWSDLTAVTGHRCSTSLWNMLHMEFHLVLHDWMSWCFSNAIWLCFSSSALLVLVLWLKCFTSRPAAEITRCTYKLNPSLIARCSTCATCTNLAVLFVIRLLIE